MYLYKIIRLKQYKYINNYESRGKRFVEKWDALSCSGSRQWQYIKKQFTRIQIPGDCKIDFI